MLLFATEISLASKTTTKNKTQLHCISRSYESTDLSNIIYEIS